MDQTFDEDGYELDEGPLDPSVFFGLFDDLADDSESDTTEAAEQDGDDAELDTSAHVAEQDTSAHFEPDFDPVAAGPSNESGTAVPPDVSPPETEPATVSWWSTAPEEQPANGRESSIASPPPIPPDVAEAQIVETAEPFTTDSRVDNGIPPVVPFTSIDSDPGSNGADAPSLRFLTNDGDTGAVTTTGARSPAELERRIDELFDRPSPSAPGDTGRGGGTMAKAALATIAVGLFAGLIVAFVLSLRSPDPALSDSVADGADATETADPAASTAIEDTPTGLAGAIATGTRPTTELLNDEFTSALSSAIGSRLDLTSLRFRPGTTELDEPSTELVVELGALLAEQPAAPVTISVRTYTESTPAANLALSSDQADSLVNSLVAAGAAPDRVRARGLGAAPLNQAQPVPNFVALTPQFGDRRLDEALAERSPFALGVPATTATDTWPLRPDGLPAIGELAEALSAFPDAEVGAAGYSFLPPSQAGIRSEADTAVVELIDFLVAAYGVDPGKITTIIPGSAVFVPTPDHGNHIWLQVGPASQGAFDVASIDPAAITFEPGSADLDAAGLATVQALSDILTSGGATVVVDVRCYEAADGAANQALSEARRDALAQALADAGVAPEQLRMYASGASSYFLDDGGSAITITVAP